MISKFKMIQKKGIISLNEYKHDKFDFEALKEIILNIVGNK